MTSAAWRETFKVAMNKTNVSVSTNTLSLLVSAFAALLYEDCIVEEGVDSSSHLFPSIIAIAFLSVSSIRKISKIEEVCENVC
jgi:hypothetical protein